MLLSKFRPGLGTWPSISGTTAECTQVAVVSTDRAGRGDHAMEYTVNTPSMLSIWKIAPALATGCSAVDEPAELSLLTALTHGVPKRPAPQASLFH